MSPLLQLPLELRDHIWELVALQADPRATCDYAGTRQPPWCSDQLSSYPRLLRTCRQLSKELAPYLYRTVYLRIIHPNQTLRWIANIGPTNASCIRHLVISFTSLLVGYTEEKYTRDRKAAWTLALRSMPKLFSLDFHFEQDSRVSSLSAPLNIDISASDPEILTNLATSALSCAQIQASAPQSTKGANWSYMPSMHFRPIDHAIFSISESMPPILVQYFNQVLSLRPVSPRGSGFSVFTSSIRNNTMDQNITGLPSSFFTDCGFYLHRTCAFNENNENASALLTYRRFPWSSETPAPMLESLFKDLPNLQYLRLGCRHLNSNFLTHVPKRLHTLDVAFTDDNPMRVADNLMTMRGICKKLFTLAIAVSPLHDREHVDEDERREVFFDRRFVSKSGEEMWRPFWRALDEIKESRVKVWEGEGPGFKRGKGS